MAQAAAFLGRLHGEAGPDSTTGMKIVTHPEDVSLKDFKCNQKFTMPLSAWQRNTEECSDIEFGKMLAKITSPSFKEGDNMAGGSGEG